MSTRNSCSFLLVPLVVLLLATIHIGSILSVCAQQSVNTANSSDGADSNNVNLSTDLPALPKNPTPAQAFANTGREFEEEAVSLSQRGTYQQALVLFNKAISLSPNNPIFYQDRALNYELMNMKDKAIADLDKAISLDPEGGRSYILRSRMYLSTNKFDLALNDATKAVKLAQDTDNCTLLADGFAAQAKALLKLNKLPEALDSATKAIDYAPENPTPYHLRAEIYKAQNNLKQSEQDEQKAKSLSAY